MHELRRLMGTIAGLYLAGCSASSSVSSKSSEQEVLAGVDDRVAMELTSVERIANSDHVPAQLLDANLALKSTSVAVASFGFAAATAGDLNGDGFSDLVVGDPEYDNGANRSKGRVFVYYGPLPGQLNAANWERGGVAFGADFGYSVASSGDFDNDGYGDLLVGAPNTNFRGPGSAFIYFGSENGLDNPRNRQGIEATGANMFASDRTNAEFGFSVSYAGDLNGDGVDDIVIGAPKYDADGVRREKGGAFVWYGSLDGLEGKCRRANCADWGYTGDRIGGRLGYAVASAGDFNGDGFSDVIVGEPNLPFNTYRFSDGTVHSVTESGRAMAWFGSKDGLVVEPSWTPQFSQVRGLVAFNVGTVGDTNGDGYADVFVVSRSYSKSNSDRDRQGVVHVWYGGESPATQTWEAAWIRLGSTHAAYPDGGTAGDFNGDSYADFIFGEQTAVYLHLGTPSGLSDEAVYRLNAMPGSARYRVGTMGDHNGDGFSDLFVSFREQVSGYVGFGSGPAVSPGWTDVSSCGLTRQPDSRIGHAVSSAGDVNGDGLADLIVGIPGFGNDAARNEGSAVVFFAPNSNECTTWTSPALDQPGASLGWSVAGIGDVNGDGFDDVAAGAPGYERDGAVPGAVLVWYGARSGIVEPANANHWIALGPHDGARFGESIAAAGDVNGDGYTDLIVGAPGFTGEYDKEGAAYLYLGTADGLSEMQSWRASGRQPDSGFGTSVAGAFDIQADGYSDILVGAPRYDSRRAPDRGAAFVWHGGPSGAPALPGLGSGGIGSPYRADHVVRGKQIGADFGRSVTGVGDVNGDGLSDIAVGSPLYDAAGVNVGRVDLWYGSRGSLTDTANWFVQGAESEEKLGYSISAIGSANGDRFSDVFIGSPFFDKPLSNSGRIQGWSGSPGGLQSEANWRISGEQQDAALGFSLAPAGDFNGDGYGDLVAGAPHSSDVKGLVNVYFGNGAMAGADRRPQQLRTDSPYRIGPLGTSDTSSSVRLSIGAVSAAGDGYTRMEWRIARHDEALSTAPVSTGRQSVRLTPSNGMRLLETAHGLTPGTAYGWQVRTINSSPYFPRTPWTSAAFGGMPEAKFRTRGPGNGPPRARMSVSPRRGRAPLTVQFDGSTSFDPDGQVVGYDWDFGDGAESTLPTPLHTYALPGEYVSTLTVYDDYMNHATTSMRIVVEAFNEAPEAAFETAINSSTIQVDAGASRDPDGTIESYRWEFGDGMLAEGRVASHTYSENGVFVITLTVVDDQGAPSALSAFAGIDESTASLNVDYQWANNPIAVRSDDAMPVYLNVNDIRVARLHRGAPTLIAVPGGTLRILGVGVPFGFAATEIILSPGENRRLTLQLDDSKSYSRPVNLDWDQLNNGLLAEDFAEITLTLSDSAGSLNPQQVERMYVRHLKTDIVFDLSRTALLRDNEAIRLTGVGTLSEFLVENDGAFRLVVVAKDFEGLKLSAEIEFQVARHDLTAVIMPSGDDPQAIRSNVPVTLSMADGDLEFSSVSSRDGSVQFPTLPAGIYTVSAVVDNGSVAYACRGALQVRSDMSVQFHLQSPDEIASGNNAIVVVE